MIRMGEPILNSAAPGPPGRERRGNQALPDDTARPPGCREGRRPAKPSDRPTAAVLPLALVARVFVVAGVAATPGVAVGEPLTVAAPPEPAAGKAALALDRPTRRLIQQGIRNEGFDPRHAGRPVRPADARCDSGLAAVAGSVTDGIPERREGEASSNGRRATPAEFRRSRRRSGLPSVEPDNSSAAVPPASTADADFNPARPTVATEVDSRNAAATNTEPTSRPAPGSAPAPGSGNPRLPPDIMVDRHLVRTERRLAEAHPAAAREARNVTLVLQASATSRASIRDGRSRPLHAASPDHSTLGPAPWRRTETTRRKTTLEANTAPRSILRRVQSGESYETFLRRLAAAPRTDKRRGRPWHPTI